VEDKLEIANEFNHYFANIGYNVSHNVPVAQASYKDFMPDRNANSIFLDPVCPQDVVDVMLKLKPKTSCGSDDISAKLMIKTIDHIVNPITHVLNLSFENGQFPSDLKLAKVIPVFKSGEQCLLNNYRPISLLSPFSKLFERVMYNKLIKFLDMNNILYHHQYGFRAKHSTIHPVVHFLNHCALANNSNPSKLTLAAFCDLSKAFDTISIDILLYKLHVYGIRGRANDWIKSFLTGRSQFVDIDSTKSDCLPLKCGVPQGSILGPLLFLIYVNDISHCTEENILSFADDTTVILSDMDMSKLFQRANTCLDNLFNWFCANKLSLNAKKTHYMIIHPRDTKESTQYDLLINDTILTRVPHCKFLGISIDESLTWKRHVANINSKISRALFKINQLKFSLPRDSLRTLYFSLLHPHLTFGILAWGNAKSTVLSKTERIQKRAMRMIYNKRTNSHTDPLFKVASILKLSDIYQLEVLLFMHDYLNNKLPISFNGMFPLNADNAYVTRQNNMFTIPRTKSRFVDKLPLYQFPAIWNNHPLSRNASMQVSRKYLKRQVKSTCLDGYLAVINCSNPHCTDCKS